MHQTLRNAEMSIIHEIDECTKDENGYRMNQTLKSMKMKIRIHVLMRN
jgi:hypothetical protein